MCFILIDAIYISGCYIVVKNKTNKQLFLSVKPSVYEPDRSILYYYLTYSCLPFQEAIREHASTLDENESRDFIDVYLKEMKKNDGINNTSFTGK